MAQEEAPEGAQVVVRAGEFARTNLRVDRAGWGDTQPVLLNDEQYPNFAEHDFDAAEAGFYEIHALYAAEQSRPVDLHVDGRLVFRAGLAGTTGSFKASSARWERAGLVYLSAGRHTLRLERAACVPHVAAVALRRDPNLMPETALEQLPPEALVRDNFPIQDWILWATGGTQEYQVRDGAFVIRNGRHTFNRPLFASMGSTGSMGSVGSQPAPTPPHFPYSPYLGIVAFAGDRPQWLLAEIDTAKLGILSLAVGDRWLHQAAGIESAYDAGRMTHTVGDPALAGGTLAITTLRLPGSAGCILRLDASRPMEVRWVFGGLRGNFSTDWAGSGGWQAGLHPEDAAGNHIELRDGTAFVTSPDLPDRVAAVAASGGPAQVVHLAEGAPDTLFATPPGQRPAAGGVLALNGEPAYLVVVAGRAAHPPAAEQTPSAEPAPRRLAGTSDTPAPNPNAAGTPDTPAPHPSAASAPDNRNTRNHAVDSPPPLRPGETLASLRENPDPRLGETFASLRESPADLFRSAEDAWRARAGRLEVRTPVPELDAAARSNNASLDGIWRPPSFLHGAVRWGSGGWYLGWRGWYGPICAGDLDRVREAIRFHARHQIEEPAAGVQSRGAFAGFVHFDGAQDRCGYDMNQVFLDHIRSYYAWSGDLETIREVWPAVKRCLEYERRQMDPDGDGLYTNNLNTFISDGHHYDGGGCTQSSAYMHSILRFAADAAARLGEDPVPYRREAEKIRAAVQRFLWRERAGTFAEYRDTDGVLHDAAEAPTIYHAVEFGLADPLQAVRATEYLSRRLWWDLGFRISDFGSAAGRTAAPSGSPGGRRRGDPAPASPHREAAATEPAAANPKSEIPNPKSLVLVNDWYPVIVTNGCLNHNESLNSALAYYYAGDFERGWRLLQTGAGAFRRATVPGSISCYAGREGEQGLYVEFADAVSLFTRCVVEGLFGLQPDVPNGNVTWSPRFPIEWPRASLRTAGYSLSYERAGTSERYVLEIPRDLAATLRVPLRFDRLKSATLNGRPAPYRGETGLDRQMISVRAPAGRKVVLELAYSNRTRFRVADPPAWVVSGDPVELSTTAGTFLGVADPEGALRGGKAHAGKLAAQAGEPGNYTLFSRLKLPHSEVLHPARLEVRPLWELVETNLLVSAAVPGQALLEVALRCNKPERVAPQVEILYAGRTYRGRLVAAETGMGERESGRVGEWESGRTGEAGDPNSGGSRGAADHARKRGVSHSPTPPFSHSPTPPFSHSPTPPLPHSPILRRFRFPVENPDRLSPGGMPVRITIRALAGNVVLQGETRLWSLFAGWPEGGDAFAARCVALDIPRNDRLEAIFTRKYEGANQPFLNCWTWYDPGTVTLDHVRECLRDDLFLTDAGVPFRVPAEGNNVLCASRWRAFPEEVEMPVGQPAEKIYLFLANTTQNSQTHLPQARVTLEYADGATEEVDLRGPEEVDHMLQHYAALAFPQWVGGQRGGYYGHGRATGAHADVVDIHPGRREAVTRLRVRCLRQETLIGILGVTVVPRP